MPVNPALTVVTVLYGGEDVLAETLPSWRSALSNAAVPVVFVDNTPGDSVADLVSELFDASVLVRRRTNPGFAASANEALALAPTDWVLLLNADVTLTAEALDACGDWIADSERDWRRECAAISLVTGGTEHCGTELNAVGYFSDRPADSSRPALGPSGGAMLIHRGTFDRAGRFDADLFAWGEDGGLGLRLTAHGVRTSELRLRLSHVGGHSVASLAGQRFKARLLARNRIRVMRRDWTVPLRLVLGPAQLALIAANGVRKLRYRTAAQHFDGVRIALLERSPRPRDRRFGLVDFARYRAARTASVD